MIDMYPVVMNIIGGLIGWPATEILAVMAVVLTLVFCAIRKSKKTVA